EPAGAAEPAGTAGTAGAGAEPAGAAEPAGTAGRTGAGPGSAGAAQPAEPAGGAGRRLRDGCRRLVDAAVRSLVTLPSRAHGPSRRRIRPGHPTEQDFDQVEPGQRLLVRGMGMSFFDAFSLLTAGRGGRFVPAEAAHGSGRTTGNA